MIFKHDGYQTGRIEAVAISADVETVLPEIVLIRLQVPQVIL